MNSKRKGKVGELELASVLRKHGFEARRTAQYCGNTGEAADVVGIDGYHIEVKRVERLNISEAVAQARRDAKGKPFIVCHRKNREDWLATVELDVLLDLIKESKDDHT